MRTVDIKTLILGGVRSGKSRLAETMALQSGKTVTYIATATADDAEMAARIARHRKRRPADWGLVEEKIHLAGAVESHAAADTCLLVDCLSLWVTNLLMSEREALMTREIEFLIDTLRRCPGELVMVSSECNMGVIPMGELSRRYCDRIGVLHQQVAAVSQRVVLTVAGLPLYLKGEKD